MLSRRLALAGPSLAALSRTAAAQNGADAGTDLLLLAPDSQPDSLKAANAIAARLGGPDAGLHAEAPRGVLDAAARLADRPAAVSAVLPSVTLAYMSRAGLPANVVYALRFIARVAVAELHVLASQRIGGLADLAGQKVERGAAGERDAGDCFGAARAAAVAGRCGVSGARSGARGAAAGGNRGNAACRSGAGAAAGAGQPGGPCAFPGR